MSILDDIDIQIEQQDINIINKKINVKDSNMRKRFPLASFKYSKDNGESTFTINEKELVYGNRVDKYDVNFIKSEIDDNIDVLISTGRMIITANDLKTEIAKKIQAGHLCINTRHINDVDISTVNSDSRRLPMIYIISEVNNDNDISITNSKLEIDYSHSYGWLELNDIPKLNNVSSKSIKDIKISKISTLDKKRIINNDFWNKLFEFGYNVEYRFDDNINKKTITGIKSLIGIAKDKNFKSLKFSEYPYRLKKGIRLCDILDVSQFESLMSITINCENMAVMLFNKELLKKEDAKYRITTLYEDMIKPAVSADGDITKLIEDIPCTDDGWLVLLCQI